MIFCNIYLFWVTTTILEMFKYTVFVTTNMAKEKNGLRTPVFL